MLKHILLVVVISVIMMFFQSELAQVLHYLLTVHDKIADGLAVIFSNALTGRVIQETTALVIIPVFVASIAGVLYWLVKRQEMPQLVIVVWFFWTVLSVAILSQPVIHHAMNRSILSPKIAKTYY